jgi:hypothetical protein
MKICKTTARQGDVYFKKITSLPEDVTQKEPNQNQYVIAHSETGHNHVIEADPRVRWWHPNQKFTNLDMLSYLEILDDEALNEQCYNDPVLLKHLRSFDTHETIAFEPGIYEVRRQREYTPEGFRLAAD